MKIAGARVLLTGASRGIGAALTEALRAKGAVVQTVARTGEGIDHHVDLADLTAIPALVEAAGPLDILINNAGVSGVGWYGDRTAAEINQVMSVNLLAPMHLSHRVLPGMLERGRGHIVSLSSMAAVFNPPGLTTYGASKAGLSHFMAGLRADYRDDPISFTTVTLGSVSTDMDHEARSYEPLRSLAEKSKGRDITPMDAFIKAVVEAIEKDKPEVRVPASMAPLAMLTNAPRKVGRLVFKRSVARAGRTPPASPPPSAP